MLIVPCARLWHLAVATVVAKLSITRAPSGGPESSRALAQLAPGGDQFVVVALDETLPGKPYIPGLRGGCSQVEAGRVGVILAQEARRVDSGATALAELSTAEVEVCSDTGCIGSTISLCEPGMGAGWIEPGSSVQLDGTRNISRSRSIAAYAIVRGYLVERGYHTTKTIKVDHQVARVDL